MGSCLERKKSHSNKVEGPVTTEETLELAGKVRKDMDRKFSGKEVKISLSRTKR